MFQQGPGCYSSRFLFSHPLNLFIFILVYNFIFWYLIGNIRKPSFEWSIFLIHFAQVIFILDIATRILCMPGKSFREPDTSCRCLGGRNMRNDLMTFSR